MEPPPARRRSRWRSLAFRLAALALGLLPLLLLEIVLWTLDLGRSTPANDPFVGFSAVNPLFELDPTRTRYQTAANRLVFFQRDSFSARKSPREFRIFVLGGSTVQGRPFSIETAFSTWLELNLKAADPSRLWQVVNCGGISYASYRLAPIVSEILQNHKPDLIILCTGHNEFLEDRSYESVKSLPPVLLRPLELLSETRTANLLLSLVSKPASDRPPPDRPLLSAEVDAMLDYRGGLRRYHRDDAWHTGVETHFAFNVERMIRACQRSHVPVLLALPVYNLDTPPFKSQHLDSLSPSDLARFDNLWNRARALYSRSMPLAITCLQRASALDPRHAGLLYALGKSLQQVGRFSEARAALLLAKDEDICPLRMTSGLRRAAFSVVDRTGVSSLDLVPIFEARSRHGILGSDWLVDHVHPSITGHQLIADLLLDRMIDLGVLSREPGWKSRREALFHKHLDSLDDFYYVKGEERLQRLRDWAAGRARKPRKRSPKPASASRSDAS